MVLGYKVHEGNPSCSFQACQDAHSQVMIWLSGSDFVANSVLAFFMVCPMLWQCSPGLAGCSEWQLRFRCNSQSRCVLCLPVVQHVCC